MPMKLLSADDFREAAKDGGQPDGTLFKFATTDPQTVDGETRTKRFVFSDATVDHSNDMIDPKGWDTSIFKRNPVALFSHMSWDPPIGRASNVSVQDGKLVGDIEFATADVYEFADTIFRLVDGGFLKAVSVGFKPKEWSFTSDKDRPYGIDFKKQTLLEISVCAVPCNPSALTEARSIGVDTAPLAEWAEKVLDNGDTVFLPRKDLEALRLQAKGAPAPRFYIQTSKNIPAEAAERIRSAVKNWQDDPKEVLILPPGVTLRSVGEAADAELEPEAVEQPAAPEVVEAAAPELEIKAGRRISAATKAKLQEVIDHHAAATKCVIEAMGSDEPDGDFDDNPDELTPQPPGSVVVEALDDLTPEERRLKEARALRASLPTND